MDEPCLYCKIRNILCEDRYNCCFSGGWTLSEIVKSHVYSLWKSLTVEFINLLLYLYGFTAWQCSHFCTGAWGLGHDWTRILKGPLLLSDNQILFVSVIGFAASFVFLLRVNLWHQCPRVCHLVPKLFIKHFSLPFSLAVKRPGWPFTVKLCLYFTISSYTFKAWCLIKHRKGFNFKCC